MKRLLTLLLVVGSAFAQSSVDSLVAAERAFAKKSRDTNIREAFLANFADDGVVFQPSPRNAKELYSKRAPVPNPPFMLDWEPAYADVSQAGDLGFTTGPFSLTDNAKHAVTDHGTFFSVWEKQKDGSWKVVLDFGVLTKAGHPLRPIKLVTGAVSNFQPKSGSDANAEVQKLMQVEASLTGANYASRLSRNAFTVQDGLEKITSETTLRKHLLNMRTVKNWKVLGGGAAKSGDLAYTYGSYQAAAIGSPDGELRMGYYARVWKRDDKGEWKIMLDNTQALYAPPPPAKKS